MIDEMTSYAQNLQHSFWYIQIHISDTAFTTVTA